MVRNGGGRWWVLGAVVVALTLAASPALRGAGGRPCRRLCRADLASCAATEGVAACDDVHGRARHRCRRTRRVAVRTCRDAVLAACAATATDVLGCLDGKPRDACDLVGPARRDLDPDAMLRVAVDGLGMIVLGGVDARLYARAVVLHVDASGAVRDEHDLPLLAWSLGTDGTVAGEPAPVRLDPRVAAAGMTVGADGTLRVGATAPRWQLPLAIPGAGGLHACRDGIVRPIAGDPLPLAASGTGALGTLVSAAGRDG